MGKMAELDMHRRDAMEVLHDQAIQDDVLIRKHQNVSEEPTPQDVVKNRNGFDYVDEGYMRWRLNQHYPIWSWEVIKYETLGDKAIVVHGRIKIMENDDIAIIPSKFRNYKTKAKIIHYDNIEDIDKEFETF